MYHAYKAEPKPKDATRLSKWIRAWRYALQSTDPVVRLMTGTPGRRSPCLKSPTMCLARSAEWVNVRLPTVKWRFSFVQPRWRLRFIEGLLVDGADCQRANHATRTNEPFLDQAHPTITSSRRSGTPQAPPRHISHGPVGD